MQVTVLNRANFRRLSDKVRLEPGANLLEQSDLDSVQKINHVKELFNRGILRVIEAPKADKSFKSGQSVADLSELKVADAIAAIEACADPSQLKRWSETEPRKSVKEALVKRHAALVDPIDNSKD